LVQVFVTIEALRTAGVEKDASALQLQQKAEATHAKLEKERK
jgi:hypothetical protein